MGRPNLAQVVEVAVGGAPSWSWAGELAALRAASVRSDVLLRELPPSRLAPHGLTLRAELTGPTPTAAGAEAGEPAASGRLLVLHDPAGQDGWDGVLRVVTLLQATLDEPMARDPMLADVAWDWLLEALDGQGAGHRAVSGTVTTTVSRGFGGRAASGGLEDAELELRCSWSPVGPLVAHLAAFCDLLGLAAGVPPVRPGVTPLRPR